MSNNPTRFTRNGILIVLSAPSGTGKTTLMSALREKENFVYSVSCTTRSARPGEVDGRDYHFLTVDEFLRKRDAGEFLESAQVHKHHYGTLKSEVMAHLESGVDVMVDVDTQGAESIRNCSDPLIRDALADVFIMPPGVTELRRRLEKRGSETEDQIAVRLKDAEGEMRHWRAYRYTILSGSIEENIDQFRAVLLAERALTRRLMEDAI